MSNNYNSGGPQGNIFQYNNYGNSFQQTGVYLKNHSGKNREIQLVNNKIIDLGD
jgi:hypothetical protein